MEPISWAEAVKGFFVALPKLIDMVRGVINSIQAAGYEKWSADLDEATRAGQEAQKNGLTLKQAVELAKKYQAVTGGIRPPAP